MKNCLSKEDRIKTMYQAKDFENGCALSLRRNIEESQELRDLSPIVLDTNDKKFMVRKDQYYPLAESPPFMANNNILRAEGLVSTNVSKEIATWDAKIRKGFDPKGKTKTCDINLFKYMENGVLEKYLPFTKNQKMLLGKIKKNMLSISEDSVLKKETTLSVMSKSEFTSLLAFVEGGPLFYKESLYSKVKIKKHFFVYNPKAKEDQYFLVKFDFSSLSDTIDVRVEQKDSGIFCFNFYSNDSKIYSICQKSRYKEAADAYLYLSSFATVSPCEDLDELTYTFLQENFIDKKPRSSSFEISLDEIETKLKKTPSNIMSLTILAGKLALDKSANPLDIRNNIEVLLPLLEKRNIFVSKDESPHIFIM